MKRSIRTATALAAAGLSLAATACATSSATADEPDRGERHSGRPSVYDLTGDEGGSKFEGIGADTRRGLFYVGEASGGEIHRGSVKHAQTQEWLAGDGTDGRYTARGITVDGAGRVYVAGGPNGIDEATGTDNGRPDLWVYSPSGELLTALQVPGENSFLNDVWIGPDGAAYFTDSNTPRIYRVAEEGGQWNAEVWSDASDVIEQREGFNLGGIVTTADRSAFVVAQGNTGLLWRFDVRDGSVSRVDTGAAELTDADGLVRQGNRLTVVRNFEQSIATLKLSADGRSAELISQRATDPDRVLTTAKELRGRILYVDSKFDEETATAPYQVLTQPYA